jgi:rhamnogalacturonan endolyase
LEGWPELGIDQVRIAFKLQEKLFNYIYQTPCKGRRQPIMIANKVKFLTTKKRFCFPIQKTQDSRERSITTYKYQYSKDNKDNHLHGWISPQSRVGFWVIIPSSEFRSGGPFKQELTSHVGPTALATFNSRHYAGEDFSGLKFQNGEPWKKVLGPVFIYINSVSENAEPRQALWKDAKNQMEIETRKWPYDFPVSDDFPHASQRGSVSGRLLINDKYINQNLFPAKSAYVGLAPPGDEGSWQLNAKGYQFWTQTDEDGYFTIKGVREANYNLFGWVPGIMGDYRYQVEIDIRPGSESTLGNLVFTPPRNGPTLWEIGIPDRTAAEFYVPDPVPGLRNHLFDNLPEKWRQYSLWNQDTHLYPDQDLVYTVGVSNYSKDWFFAHVTRRISDKIYAPTTWQISFDLNNVVPGRIYTFRLALASANQAHLQIRVNRPDSPRPHFSTGGIGHDNAIARHGIHGPYRPFNFSIPGSMLLQGTNTIFLKQAHGAGLFNGLMYDYLRLEGPA